MQLSGGLWGWLQTPTTWDDTKKVILKKYQDYFKTRDLREEIFGMTQKEGESLKDFVETFQYNL